MKRIALRLACLGLSCVVMAVTSSGLYAQSYPNKAIQIIMPYPAGGASDLRTRVVAENLSRSLEQRVLVVNKAGADGSIGTEMVARSEPDGYTLLYTVHGPFVVNPVLRRKLPYDPMDDFEHITQLISMTTVLVVNASLPARSVKELIALAKSRPGQLNYATPSSSYYLFTEMFKLKAGLNIVYIPYKGSTPAITSLVTGETQMMFTALLSMLPQIKANKVRAIAVGGVRRSPTFPDVPTMAESGISGYETGSWAGISAPARTPKEIVKRLHTEIVKILQMPSVKDRFESGGDTIVGSTPEEFTTFIKAELARNRDVVRSAGIPLVD